MSPPWPILCVAPLTRAVSSGLPVINTARSVPHHAEEVDVLGDGELVEEDVVLRADAE